MPMTPKGYRRRNSLRHPTYDYTMLGAYFVTICQHRRDCVFGHVVDQVMILNPLGELAQTCLLDWAKRHTTIAIDVAQIMPNHAHLLLWLNRLPGLVAAPPVPKTRRFGDMIAGSLSTLIGAYTGSVTQRARHLGLWPSTPLWQDNFHDRIVRNEEELAIFRAYIQANPARWQDDQLHPNAPPNPFNRP